MTKNKNDGSASINVENLVYVIRGEKVKFDSDLANLYGVETKVLVQAMKRNIERFPSDFMFQLNSDEYENLRSQFVTSSWGGRRYPPYVFTEQGVAMLSSVFRSPKAINVNIEIMRAFVRIRQMLSHNQELSRRLDELEKNYDQQFKIVFDAIKALMQPVAKKSNPIGFIWPKEDENKRNS